MELAKYIDHTKLGPTVLKEDIDKLIDEALKYRFKSVCISPVWVSYAKERLEGSGVLVCTTIGFPHGTQTAKVKVFETKQAIKDGADEIDMVVHIADIKIRNRKALNKEIKGVVKAALGKTVKVIIETSFLDQKEIGFVSKLAAKAGARFVKTSTGYASAGANEKDVKTMKKAVGDLAEVKASGGIRSQEDALKMLDAGATRLGTSSGVKIIKGESSDVNTSY